jgi:serine protease inhibitor
MDSQGWGWAAKGAAVVVVIVVVYFVGKWYSSWDYCLSGPFAFLCTKGMTQKQRDDRVARAQDLLRKV